MLCYKFESVQRPLRVGRKIDARTLDTRTQPGKRREIDYRIEATLGENRSQRIAILNVVRMKGKSAMPDEILEPVLLKADVVGVVEVVHSDHLVAVLEQHGRRPRTDKSSTPCEQNFHANNFLDTYCRKHCGDISTLRLNGRDGPTGNAPILPAVGSQNSPASAPTPRASGPAEPPLGGSGIPLRALDA